MSTNLPTSYFPKALASANPTLAEAFELLGLTQHSVLQATLSQVEVARGASLLGLTVVPLAWDEEANVFLGPQSIGLPMQGQLVSLPLAALTIGKWVHQRVEEELVDGPLADASSWTTKEGDDELSVDRVNTVPYLLDRRRFMARSREQRMNGQPPVGTEFFYGLAVAIIMRWPFHAFFVHQALAALSQPPLYAVFSRFVSRDAFGYTNEELTLSRAHDGVRTYESPTMNTARVALLASRLSHVMAPATRT